MQEFSIISSIKKYIKTTQDIHKCQEIVAYDKQIGIWTETITNKSSMHLLKTDGAHKV